MLSSQDQMADEQHLCGKLVKDMYRTRDATQSCQKRFAETIKELGCNVGKVSRCHSYHGERHICGLLHGGDFVVAEAEHRLKYTSEFRATKHKVKVATTSSHHQMRPLAVILPERMSQARSLCEEYGAPIPTTANPMF